jgi:hypothetical protein
MRRIVASVAVLAMLPTLIAAPVPKGLTAADLFPLQMGHKWEYVDAKGQPSHVEEVTDVAEKDGAKIVTVTRTRNGVQGTKSVFRVDKDGVSRVSVGPLEYSPPLLFVKPTVKEGETWTAKLSIGKSEAEYEITVGKAEEITTPAGKFNAIPVRQQNLINKSAAPLEYWFAPNVGLVKSGTARGLVTELKAFTPGKADGKR